MALRCAYQSHTLKFRFEAGTSRGILTEKNIYILKVWEEGKELFGLGEVGPLAGLSPDDGTDYIPVLEHLSARIENYSLPDTEESCLDLVRDLVSIDYPSLVFGLEMALLDLWNGGRRILFQSAFTAGKSSIPVNGLIWMGSEDFMWSQAMKKTEEGYSCLKMKIGAIDFEAELRILSRIRAENTGILRVDANGAFSPDGAPDKLKQLSKFDLHSIEQPIRAGQVREMAELCKISPVPVALDEELIGVHGEEKRTLLETIRPAYVILKPGLLGGLRSVQEWIRHADDLEIGWWITSALESNIGLNAISQFTFISNFQGHQGLGTGQLYENNFDSPLIIRHGYMHYDPAIQWKLNLPGL